MIAGIYLSAARRFTSGGALRRTKWASAPGSQRSFSESAPKKDSGSSPETALHISGRHYISVAGIDRQRFLQGLCTNDVAKIAPGTSLPAAFLNAKVYLNITKFIYIFPMAQGECVLILHGQGRVVADSLIHRCELDGEEVIRNPTLLTTVMVEHFVLRLLVLLSSCISTSISPCISGVHRRDRCVQQPDAVAAAHGVQAAVEG
jgi:hypothetical protein